MLSIEAVVLVIFRSRSQSMDRVSRAKPPRVLLPPVTLADSFYDSDEAGETQPSSGVIVVDTPSPTPTPVRVITKQGPPKKARKKGRKWIPNKLTMVMENTVRR